MSSSPRERNRFKKTMENVREETRALKEVDLEGVKEIKPIQNQHLPKKHPNDITKTIQNNEYHNQRHRGPMDDSNIFVIKALVVWIFICVPGNIFAMTIFWRHGEKLEPHEQLMGLQVNHSVRAYSAFENDTQQPKEYIDERITGIENNIQAGADLAHFESTTQMQDDNTEKTTEVTQCYELIDASMEHSRRRLRFWIEGVLLFAIGCLGLIGNVTTVFVLRGEKRNRNFHVLIICLTIADIILILDSVLQKSIVQHFLKPPEWYNKTYPHIWHPLKGISLSATIFMVVAVSAERFRAVCHPMSRNHSPCKFILFVVTISIMTRLPRFFHFELKDDGTDYRISNMMQDPIYIRFSSYWDDIVVTGCIPLLLLMYFHSKMYLKIRLSKKLQNQRHVGGQSTVQSIKMTQISRKSLGKRVQPQSNDSNETIGEQQNCNITSQNNATNSLGALDSNLRRCGHANLYDEQSKDYLEDSEETRNIRRLLEENDEKSHSHDSQIKVDQNVEREITTKTSSQKISNTRLSIADSNNQNHKRIPSISSLRKSIKGFKPESIRNGFSPGKSTVILVVIVVLFFITHSNRLALKIYMVSFPQLNTRENFTRCSRQGRYHVPFVLYILQHLNNLFIVLNSSVNFIIYCCVAKEFRQRAFNIFRRRFS